MLTATSPAFAFPSLPSYLFCSAECCVAHHRPHRDSLSLCPWLPSCDSPFSVWCALLVLVVTVAPPPPPPLLRLQQSSVLGQNSKAIFSELTLTCGCQCSVKPPAPNATKVVPTRDGECAVLKDTTPHYKCDYIGDAWCNTVPSLRYVLTGTGDACEQRSSVIQRVLSTYAPSNNFGPAPAAVGETESGAP